MSNHINPDMHSMEGTFDQAYSNIKAFIEDSEVPLTVSKGNFEPNSHGYFSFELSTPLVPTLKWEIEMPSCPLDKVKFIGEEQNPMEFKRIWIDGASWLWKHALIKKYHVIQHIESEIDDLEATLHSYHDLLEHVNVFKK